VQHFEKRFAEMADDDHVIDLVTCDDSIQTGQHKGSINRDGLKSGLMMATTTAPSNDLFVIKSWAAGRVGQVQRADI
jgi:hypothetical protein